MIDDTVYHGWLSLWTTGVGTVLFLKLLFFGHVFASSLFDLFLKPESTPIWNQAWLVLEMLRLDLSGLDYSPDIIRQSHVKTIQTGLTAKHE